MLNLPPGTYTFLCADGDAQHPPPPDGDRTVLRDAIAAQDGFLVQTDGTMLCAEFASATSALIAAAAGQRAMRADDDGSLLPRMALHTAEVVDDASLRAPLDRLGLLLTAAHPGQILVDLTTANLVRDRLPTGAHLLSLGEHRFSDLGSADRLFQLVAPGLPTRFPPIKSLDWHPHNLPVPLTTFVGREREVEAIQHSLREPDLRLLTLTGPGGIGKTRLALQAAAGLVDAFDDGVFFVSLAAIADPELVVPTIAQTLAIAPSAGRPLLAGLVDYLRERELLLVLDNFEQVVTAAPAVVDLLQGCPRLRVLVTSREILDVRGEQEHRVPPLALPDPRHWQPTERLTEIEGVRLFIARARAMDPNFAVTDTTAPLLAEICRRVDGLPLAIELAAARTRVFSPGLLLTALQRRLALLTGGPRDAPARHQTLRDTIAWSHDLLSPDEQALFRRLAVFVGGFTLEAAEAVAGTSVLDGLTALVQKSLLRPTDQVEGGADAEPPRFTMLETLREYGLEQSEAHGEAAAIRAAHAAYFLDLVERADPELWGPHQVAWMNRLEADHDNLRAALRWSLDQSDAESGADMALRFGASLLRFWSRRGHLREAHDWLERALAKPGDVTPGVRARAYLYLGHVARDLGDSRRALTLYEACLTIFQEQGDTGSVANALNSLAMMAAEQGDYERARILYEDSVAVYRGLGFKHNLSFAIYNLGELAVLQGEYSRARGLFEEALASYEELGDTSGIAFTQGMLGQVARLQRQPLEAGRLLEQSLARLRATGDKQGIGLVLEELGQVAREQGDDQRATSLYQEALTLLRDLGDKPRIVLCLEGLAGVAATQGQPERSAQLAGAAAAWRGAVGAQLPPSERVALDHDQAVARKALGEGAFEAAWTAGFAMPLEQAVAVAFDVVVAPTEARRRGQPMAATALAGLTARELDVLRLIEGHSNEEIAEALYIAKRTVTTHIQHIFNKLGVNSRAAAAAYAVRHGLD